MQLRVLVRTQSCKPRKSGDQGVLSSHVQLVAQVMFTERRQALLHGDLHTGSLLVTPNTTHVIDAGTEHRAQSCRAA